MKLARLVALMFLLSFSLNIFGCGGGGADIRQQNITLGQELKDLDEAYQKGLLTEKEYKKVREELIEKYTD